MPDTENLITYGVCNVHCAPCTYDATQKKYTYETPFAMPGCTAISLPASGSTDKVYADDIPYYVTETNNGYEGTATFVKIPDKFRTDVLCEVNGEENSDTVTKEYALLFEFSGDKNHTRHVMYRCKSTRPDIASSTKEEKVTPNTETLNISATPRINDHYIKKTVKATDEGYATFFGAVIQPTGAGE